MSVLYFTVIGDLNIIVLIIVFLLMLINLY